MVYIMQMLQPSGAAVRRRSNSALRAVDWPDRDKKWLRPKDPDLKYYEKYTLSNGAPWIATVPGLTGGSDSPGNLFISGVPINPSTVPTKAKFDHPQMKDTFCVFYSGIPFVYVCDTFKDIVEDYEPGVHQFFPIDFVWKDGSPAMRRYLFNVCNRVEYIDLGRSDVETKFKQTWQIKRDGKLHVWPKAVEGMAFWRDKTRSSWQPFVAAEIVEKIEATGMKGPVFQDWLPGQIIEQD